MLLTCSGGAKLIASRLPPVLRMDDNDETRIFFEDPDKGPDLTNGAIFGQYRIERLLGKGGMGEVYAVEHTTLGKRYALKLLSEEIADTPGSLERFRREARVMAQLEHRRIVPVDEFGETSGRYWLRMALMPGIETEQGTAESLADLIKLSGDRLDEETARRYLRDILEGLAYAHGKGAIHRDIKPANILLSPDGARISDFGLVNVAGAEWYQTRIEQSVAQSMTLERAETMAETGDTERRSSMNALLGTYEFMSPEQKRGEELDGRSDLYSVGLMAFRMFTGQ